MLLVEAQRAGRSNLSILSLSVLSIMVGEVHEKEPEVDVEVDVELVVQPQTLLK